MVCIVGPMYSVYQALQSTNIARDQLIATSLAQEGIEYVRHHRDNNYLYNVKNPSTPVSWMKDLDNCQVANKACAVDVMAGDSTPPARCAGTTCSYLYLNTSGIYTPTNSAGAAQTRFSRSVQITTVTLDQEVIVTSTVEWINAGIPYHITVTEHLYNWL
jgi:hypothetical protein